MNEKTKEILKALKCEESMVFRCPELPCALNVIIDDTSPTRVVIDGMQNKLYVNTTKENHIVLFEVYYAVADKVDIDNYKVDAAKFIDAREFNLKTDVRWTAICQMACDRFAIEGSRYFGPLKDIIPYKSTNDSLNTDMELKYHNKLVGIRRSYATNIITQIKDKYKKKPRKYTKRELRAMEQNLDSLAEMAGYKEPVKKRKNKSDLVTICQNNLKLCIDDRATFEECCSVIIKTFGGNEPNFEYFVGKKTKMNLLYPSIHAFVINTLIPQYKKYQYEISMAKRGPLRDLIKALIEKCVVEDKVITSMEIERTMESVHNHDDNKFPTAPRGLRSWNELTPKEKEMRLNRK